MSGSLIVRKDNAGIGVDDTTVSHQISLASNDGNAGIYDNEFNKWIIQSNSNGAVTVNGDTTIKGTLIVNGNYQIEASQIVEYGNQRSVVEFGQHLYLYSNTEGVLLTGSSTSANSFRPNYDTSLKLGNSSYKWDVVYASTGTINTSDRNLKTNFSTFDDRHEKFFMSLIPQTFKYKNGTSGRTHFGFIAQDVEAALDKCGLSSLDFAGFCKDIKTESVYDEKGKYKNEVYKYDMNGNPEYIYSLRYTEFISLITHMVQKLYNDKIDIENRLSELENKN